MNNAGYVLPRNNAIFYGTNLTTIISEAGCSDRDYPVTGGLLAPGAFTF